MQASSPPYQCPEYCQPGYCPCVLAPDTKGCDQIREINGGVGPCAPALANRGGGCGFGGYSTNCHYTCAAVVADDTYATGCPGNKRCP